MAIIKDRVQVYVSEIEKLEKEKREFFEK